jgi:chemotaxis protein CheX
MLDRTCAAMPDAAPVHADIAARITFSGALSAQCVVEFPASSARCLACAFLGTDDSAMVGDAVGELCNMIAGGWKTRLGPPAWGADLSVPAISRQLPRDPSNAQVDAQSTAGAAIVRRAYTFEDASFVVSLTAL